MVKPLRPLGLLVVGMHRSGTSAVTRTLNLLGASLPTELIGAAPSNPQGHWESQRICDLHNKVLSGIDSRWDEWMQIDPAWFTSPTAEGYAHELALILIDEFSDHPLFVVKDPRLCRLVPLWSRAAEIAEFDLRAVIPLRHPLEVASSLKVRDGIATASSMLIWLRNMLDAEKDTRILRRVMLTYDDLLNDWRGAMRRAARALDVSWPRWTPVAEYEIEDFLKPEHRHHVTPAQSRTEPEWAWTLDAHRALLRLTQDPGDQAARAALDEIRSNFDHACKVFWPALYADRAKLDAQRQIVKKERSQAQELAEQRAVELAERDTALDASQRDREALLSRIDAVQSQVQSLETDRSILSHERDLLLGELAERDISLNSLEVQIGSLEAERSNMAAEHVRLAMELSQREEALKLSAQQQGALRVRLDEITAQVRGLEDQRSSLRIEASALAQALAERDAALVERAGEVDRLGGMLRDHNARVSELEVRISEMDAATTASQAALMERDAELVRALEQLASAERAGTRSEHLVGQLRGDVEVANIAVVRFRAQVAELALQLGTVREQFAAETDERDRQIRKLRKRLGGLRDLLPNAVESRARIAAQGLEIDRLKAMQVQADERVSRVQRGVERASRNALIQLTTELNRTVAQLTRPPKPNLSELRKELSSSGLFDAGWYLARNPDVRLASRDPLGHYISIGAAAGLQPHPLFSAAWYASANGDATSIPDALIHYLRTGGCEGASPHPLFHGPWYLASNPDVAKSGANPLVHYLRWGWREGRDPHPQFEGRWYLEQNPEVAAAGVNPLVHYAAQGLREGRAPSSRLNASAIKALEASALFGRQAGDPSTVISDLSSALSHVFWAARRGDSPHVLFDVAWYRSQQPKLDKWGVDPAVHFVTSGWKKGLSPHPLFQTGWYLANNPDVARAGVNPLDHFIAHGWREGRSPHPDLDMNQFHIRLTGRSPIDADPLTVFVRWGETRLRGVSAEGG